MGQRKSIYKYSLNDEKRLPAERMDKIAENLPLRQVDGDLYELPSGALYRTRKRKFIARGAEEAKHVQEIEDYIDDFAEQFITLEHRVREIAKKR